MWFLIPFVALVTAWVDLFFLPAIAPNHALYTSTVALVLFLAYRSPRAALSFAITSGILADIIGGSTPFGVSVVINVLLCGAAHALMRQFFSGRTASSLAPLSAATALIAVLLVGITGYVANRWRLDAAVSFFDVLHPRTLLTTPLAAGLLAVFFAYIARLAADIGHHWFFVRKRAR